MLKLPTSSLTWFHIMALVANYDSGSSADESSDHEEDSAMVEITRPIVEKEKDLISDDEDDDRGGQDVGPSVLDETEEDIVEFGTRYDCDSKL